MKENTHKDGRLHKAKKIEDVAAIAKDELGKKKDRLGEVMERLHTAETEVEKAKEYSIRAWDTGVADVEGRINKLIETLENIKKELKEHADNEAKDKSEFNEVFGNCLLVVNVNGAHH